MNVGVAARRPSRRSALRPTCGCTSPRSRRHSRRRRPRLCRSRRHRRAAGTGSPAAHALESPCRRRAFQEIRASPHRAMARLLTSLVAPRTTRRRLDLLVRVALRELRHDRSRHPSRLEVLHLPRDLVLRLARERNHLADGHAVGAVAVGARGGETASRDSGRSVVRWSGIGRKRSTAATTRVIHACCSPLVLSRVRHRQRLHRHVRVSTAAPSELRANRSRPQLKWKRFPNTGRRAKSGAGLAKCDKYQVDSVGWDNALSCRPRRGLVRTSALQQGLGRILPMSFRIVKVSF